MSSASQARQMEALFRRGPVTIVLVFSPSCPHCHTYMPLWKKLEQTKGRQANMVSMRADIYDKTPMSEKKPVQAVPTVLFVDKEGHVSEAKEPRNMTTMSNAVRMGVSEQVAATATIPASSSSANRRISSESEIFDPASSVASSYRASTAALSASMPRSQPIQPVIPGTVVSENPLRAVPATPISEVSIESESGSRSVQMGGAYGVQYGGNPWAAFMMAARQAAPAAALLGAYVALPKRSSGLPATRKRRR